MKTMSHWAERLPGMVIAAAILALIGVSLLAGNGRLLLRVTRAMIGLIEYLPWTSTAADVLFGVQAFIAAHQD